MGGALDTNSHKRRLISYKNEANAALLRTDDMKTSSSILISAVLLATGIANGQNLLSNGDFNSPAGTPPTDYAFPTSWSDWSGPDWNNAWANRQNDGSSFDGSRNGPLACPNQKACPCLLKQ